MTGKYFSTMTQTFDAATHESMPAVYHNINEDTKASGFTMASDQQTCSLLRTLAASKRSAQFLELGTGTGLSTSCILDGMDRNSSLISIDNDPALLSIAQKYLGNDPRLQLILTDGEEWLLQHIQHRFDYIFADTWHGKYLLLNETLSMLNKGGLYILDDMLPQPNWPEGHQEKAGNLVHILENRSDLIMTKLSWATGIIIAVKK